MADQDFTINIKTLADLTGIKLTQQELNALQTAAKQGNQQAIGALKQLADAQKQAAGAASGLGLGSFTGIGAIVTLLTGAISKWKAFNDEQDRIVAKMMEVTRRNYEMAQSILAVQDAEIAARRTGSEPLAQSYIRLQQELIRLKTEQASLNLPSQSKDWQEYQKQIDATSNQISKVQSDLKQKGISDVTPTAAGPKAGKGESQALVDEIERNRKAAEEQLKEDVWELDPETGGYRRSGQKQFPTFQAPPPPTPGDFNTPTSRQYPSPIGPPLENKVQELIDLFKAVWGPM